MEAQIAKCINWIICLSDKLFYSSQWSRQDWTKKDLSLFVLMQSSNSRESIKALHIGQVKCSWTQEILANSIMWRLIILCKVREISLLKVPTQRCRCALQAVLTIIESTGTASIGAPDQMKGLPLSPLKTRGRNSWTWWPSIKVALIRDFHSPNCPVLCAVILRFLRSTGQSKEKIHPRDQPFLPLRNISCPTMSPRNSSKWAISEISLCKKCTVQWPNCTKMYKIRSRSRRVLTWETLWILECGRQIQAQHLRRQSVKSRKIRSGFLIEKIWPCQRSAETPQ